MILTATGAAQFSFMMLSLYSSGMPIDINQGRQADRQQGEADQVHRSVLTHLEFPSGPLNLLAGDV